MNIPKNKTYLAVSGVLLLVVGGYISLNPTEYLGQFGMNDVINISFYSDLRAMGGSLFVFGLIAIAGCIRQHLEKSALFTSTAIFSAYSFFRVMAIALDGMPGDAILTAAFIEIAFALMGCALMFASQFKQTACKEIYD